MRLQRATLLLATLAAGMMAGVFALYSHTIMPGLGSTDDRTFVGAFQALDRAILNPFFLPTFLGALLFAHLLTDVPLLLLLLPALCLVLVLESEFVKR